ncbi:molybdenum cofactor guanylyltransferase [Campylobacter sp. VicNov18]|uniref:molybdenum cofactor guanylyltransferase n=1 Tax=Campylobacter bilis TaxID=2691918 RepID=UPI00130E2DC5|nr:molybdenum cofactor guanylyltransferase [Campylobacter bilis]MPV64244.1 NTP transferase domain-containing protein [Campylobacter hepaticus]MBM0637749.1 NTP transferase domain-containing protein [Campylobacter bilis]MCC8278475.1 molybdenum cofactor guanylyltransferase [Campylobacter bilis]MCC8299979.1 molybdenum cofactor guanylyltransferase [Campylobacter bilis]MCC8301384.1 molybdenum cofactor guanylyltransferase [Campylobacter bilis]
MRLKDLNCVILCGGKSSRMGQDKSKLMIKDQNLTQFQVEKFSKIFKKVYISAKEDKFQNAFKLIKDSLEFHIYSPMLALYSILSYFKEEYVFILSVDTPKLSQNEIIKMLPFLDQKNQIIIAKSPSYKHPLCGFYHSRLAEKCKKLLEKQEYKIGLLFSQAQTHFVEFSNEDAFLNLNFYEEYEKFKKEFNKDKIK